MFTALESEDIVLYLINENNLAEVHAMFQGFPDSDYMLSELSESYRPEFENDKQTKYGFYSTLHGTLAGLSLLGIDRFKEQKGYTGSDTLLHMRGKGVSPKSKPHLFYLAFEILNLNRVATGCLVSNTASKRSIEKTVGFTLEGTFRESGLNDEGKFEDEYMYAILRRDWQRLYGKTKIKVIP